MEVHFRAFLTSSLYTKRIYLHLTRAQLLFYNLGKPGMCFRNFNPPNVKFHELKYCHVWSGRQTDRRGKTNRPFLASFRCERTKNYFSYWIKDAGITAVKIMEQGTCIPSHTASCSSLNRTDSIVPSVLPFLI